MEKYGKPWYDIMKEHIKGTEYYEMTKWLLEHYMELNHYHLSRDLWKESEGYFGIASVTGFISPDPRKKNLAFEDSFTFSEKLIEACDDALEAMRDIDISKARIIYIYYMDWSLIDCSSAEKIDILGFTNGGFYKTLYRAIARFSKCLWDNLSMNRNLPFCLSDINGCKRIFAYMKESVKLHEPDGECYKDTERLLKNYLKVKYSGVQDRLNESVVRLSDSFGIGKIYSYYDALDKITTLEVDDRIKSWLYSSMVENTGAYVQILEKAVDGMRALGSDGEEYYEYIRTMFMDPRYLNSTWDKKRDALGLTHRVYYCRRIEAISMVSKLLWGVLAQRHTESVFHKYDSRFS